MRACVGALVCTGAVAAVVAYAAHQWFYVLLLYGFLIGMTGGLMAWMVLDEFDPGLQGTGRMAVAGAAAAAVTYLLYEFLRYRLDVSGFDLRPGWWDHLVETGREGVAFGRVGRTSTIDLGTGFVWGFRVLESAIAVFVGGAIARQVDIRR